MENIRNFILIYQIWYNGNSNIKWKGLIQIMKYYIDFDNTLFETPKLTKAMLKLLTNAILEKHENKNFEETFVECKSLFNREHFYNIFELIEHFSHIYELDEKNVVKNMKVLISDTKEFLYPDTIPFLERLKAEGHELYILSYCKESLTYLTAKISGSGIADYFNAIYATSTPKYELGLNYEEGIFIDDNPSDLKGLYGKNPRKIIRIARNGNKYSLIDLDIPEIKSYNSFENIEKLD